MVTFLVEGYLAAGTAERLGEFRTAATRASQEMARDGICVRYLSAVFLPADQTCFVTPPAAWDQWPATT